MLAHSGYKYAKDKINSGTSVFSTTMQNLQQVNYTPMYRPMSYSNHQVHRHLSCKVTHKSLTNPIHPSLKHL